MSQPLTDLLTAVRARAIADGPLMALLTGIFSGRAPKDQAMNYLVIPDMTSEPMRTFTGGAARLGRGLFPMRIWARDHLEVAAIYAELVRVFDRQKIAIANDYQVSGSLSLTATIPDPGDTIAVQGVVRYGWITHVKP